MIRTILTVCLASVLLRGLGSIEASLWVPSESPYAVLTAADGPFAAFANGQMASAASDGGLALTIIVGVVCIGSKVRQRTAKPSQGAAQPPTDAAGAAGLTDEARKTIQRIEAIAKTLLSAQGEEAERVARDALLRYVPDTIAAYLALAPKERSEADGIELAAQLGRIEAGLAEAAQGRTENERRRIIANGRFLTKRFPVANLSSGPQARREEEHS